MSLWAPPPEPKTPLGRYRVLSKLAGVRVSPIQLGAASLGESKWIEYGMGAMNAEASFKLLDAYYEAGGNFIDVANDYQDEASEKTVGEWMEKRGVRDQIVLTTKYTTNYKRGHNDLIKVNYAGNSVKSMRISLADSLKKLRTSYIDIFYVHWWDWTTSIEEVMDGLHNLVVSGKVLYLGISDTPAWIVSAANQYAKDHGKTPFVIYQGKWNIMDRSFEREIIPMAQQLGLALAPWQVLAEGKLRSDAEEERRRKSGENGRTVFGPWERSEDEKKVSHALEKVAKEVGLDADLGIPAVAIAYVMQKTPYVFPIIGGRKVEHLMSNIEALKISLSDEQIKYLESIIPFNPGFPQAMIGDSSSTSPLLPSTGHIDFVRKPSAIKPTK